MNWSAPEGAARLSAALADRYTIQRELGQGGMATVYLAHDIKHDRKVAIKVLHPDLAATIGVERFLSEIKVTANLQHPNILGLFDSGIADGQAYYVMPFVDGESLRDRLTREKQLPVADALRIATGVAAALEYAHAHGVIHRDIKPENILLQSGQPVVADFGIALAVQQAGGQRLTQTGMSLGTPQYMSPEQAMGERTLDARTDIYALGVITYEMLAGEPPFSGPNAQAIVAQVLTGKPKRLTELRDTVPPAVEAAVHQALLKLPADRFASAKDFADALRASAATSAQFTAAPATTRAPSSLASRFTPFVALAAIVGIAAFLLGRRSGSSGELPAAWQGDQLDGPLVAMAPIVSRDGQLVAFQAMVDGQTQLGILKPQSGDWNVLTTEHGHGSVGQISWSRDNSTVYFDRYRDVPTGVFSISPLGGEERLVLADAGQPDVLPDGSLLVVRINADRNLQLYHLYPESGRLDTLPVIAAPNQNNLMSRASPDAKEAAFFGRPASQKDSADHLNAIDLRTNRVRLLTRDPGIHPSALAFTPDSRWVVVTSGERSLLNVVAISVDGSGRSRVRTTLTNPVYGISIGPDGSLYFDQFERPIEMVRYTPADRHVESSRPLGPAAFHAIPLADNRILYGTRIGGTPRVMVLAPGKQPIPFMATSEPSLAPIATLGHDNVALVLGKSAAVVSAATGQIVRRLANVHPLKMAGAPDGKTLYYVESNSVWAIPSEGGTPRKIRDGDAVAIDPAGRYLVIEVDEATRVHLFHVPLDGSPEHEIIIKGDVHPASIGLTPNAVGPDGRLVVQMAPPNNWFWPAAIVDPATGKVDILPPGATSDMYGGWTADGHVLYFQIALQSRLWRFRPAGSKDSTR